MSGFLLLLLLLFFFSPSCSSIQSTPSSSSKSRFPLSNSKSQATPSNKPSDSIGGLHKLSQGIRNLFGYSYSRLSFPQKGSTTPLFFVTNSEGHSYMQNDAQNGLPGQRTVFYYMSSEDAKYHLEEMSQVNSQNINEFRLSVTSLEKVLNQIQAKKQSSKLGKQSMDIVSRIIPSSRQVNNAVKIVGSKGMKNIAIPSFTVPGLEIQRKNGEIISPYYLSLEDLLSDWKENQIQKTPQIRVFDLARLSLVKARKSKLLNLFPLPSLSTSYGIVPPKKEIDLLRDYYRDRTFVRGEYTKASGTTFKQ